LGLLFAAGFDGRLARPTESALMQRRERPAG